MEIKFDCTCIVKFLIRFTIEFNVDVKLSNNLMFFSKLFLIKTNINISLFSFTLNDKDEDLIVKLNKRVLLKNNLFTITYITLILFKMSIFRISI